MKYPRATAVRVLTRVLSDREPLEIPSDLEPAQRAWLQEICAGTLRWKGRLDGLLDSLAAKKKPTGWLRKILLLSAYQLIVQDRVQAGAVVSESVDEVKKKEGEAPAKFVNACLRKVAEHGAAYRDLKFDPKMGAAEAASWASMPEWFWSKIVAKRGVEWAAGFARACLDRPVVWIRSREGTSQLEGAVTEAEGFKEGRFFVQDISSQTLIEEVSKEVRKVLGEGPLKALDLCAAPGGKTVGLAWNGFVVTATDRVEERFKLLRETVARTCRENTPNVIARGEVKALPPQDLVWVDAPCSGSGIIRRHPDVRWLRQEKEIASLNSVQRELLTEAWEKVRPGGFLVYSVCSVFAEEGEELFQSAKLGGKKIREWLLSPHIAPHGDGFWAVLVERTDSH